MFSLILPTYNEAENVPRCVEAVCRVLSGRDFEIVVADDNSPDRTWEVAENLSNPHVRVLRRMSKRGLSAAVVEGFEFAGGEFLGVMDADLQHDESILPQMIDALETNEFVIGARTDLGDWSMVRRFSSRAAAAMARAVLGVRISDPMSGYFVLKREVFERVKQRLSPRGFKIMLELFCLARPRCFSEVGYKFRTRQAGESKVSASVATEYIKSLFELRRKIRGN